jgi:hypothetical protein
MNQVYKRLSIRHKINIFYEKIKELKYLPNYDNIIQFEDGTYMHTFWYMCKSRDRFDKEMYKKLLDIDCLNDDYNRSTKIFT